MITNTPSAGQGLLFWRRDKPLTHRSREALYGYLLISPWLIGFVVFTLGPIIGAFGISLYDTDFLTHASFVGLQWYRAAIQDSLVQKSLMNTAYFTFTVVPLSNVLAISIAVLLNQGVKGQGVWRTVYYLPSVVSGVAVALLWRWIYHPELGLINSLLTDIGIHGPRWLYSEDWAMPALIIMATWSAGGAMLIYLAGLRSIPTQLYEAASIDGAGALRKFSSVTIPMLTPTIFFNVVINIIGAWQVFTQSYIMTQGGPNNATLTMVLYIFQKGFQQFYFGYAAAIAWLLFVVILIFVLLAIRSSEIWVHYERV